MMSEGISKAVIRAVVQPVDLVPRPNVVRQANA